MYKKDLENGGKNCGNCRFFCRQTKKPRKRMALVYGDCRRLPPVREIGLQVCREQPYQPVGWAWPQMHSENWCGEHQERARDGE